MDDKMHCQQRVGIGSYKDESCSTSNVHFLYNHRLGLASNLLSLSFQSHRFATGSDENEVLCLLPRIRELHWQLSRRL